MNLNLPEMILWPSITECRHRLSTTNANAPPDEGTGDVVS
jgi:hypothetical protein